MGRSRRSAPCVRGLGSAVGRDWAGVGGSRERGLPRPRLAGREGRSGGGAGARRRARRGRGGERARGRRRGGSAKVAPKFPARGAAP